MSFEWPLPGMRLKIRANPSRSAMSMLQRRISCRPKKPQHDLNNWVKVNTDKHTYRKEVELAAGGWRVRVEECGQYQHLDELCEYINASRLHALPEGSIF